MIKNINDCDTKEVIQKIEQVLNSSPEHFDGFNTIYHYEITDKNFSFQLQLSEGVASVQQETLSQPDCTLQMTFNDFRNLLLGKLSGTTALLSGKLKIKGDIGKATRMEKLFRKYDFEN